MRLLLDTCAWGGARTVLRNAGHDVVWSGDWDNDPGDEAILALAYQEQRVLVTLDKDFGELALWGIGDCPEARSGRDCAIGGFCGTRARRYIPTRFDGV